MKTVLAELEKLQSLIGTLPRKGIVPKQQDRATLKALEHVLKTWDVSARPAEDRLLRARREILNAQRDRRDLSSLHPAILRDCIWLLWPGSRDGVDRHALRTAVLGRIATDRAALRRLIDVWLLAFDPEDDSFVEVGKQLRRHLAAPHTGLLAMWKETHKSYNIFDAVTGPVRMADRLLQDSSDQLLAACRMDSPARAATGYLRVVHVQLSAKLPKMLSGDHGLDHLDRATRFYAPDGRLRFDERTPNGAMADGLVGAWIRTQRHPSDRMRKMVLSFLRRQLGDPRVDPQGRWAQASEETRQKVRTWLSALSLDAFFDIIGRFAGDAGMGRQWAARKAFWKACLKGGHITDSWLVLGDNAARAISNNAELRGSYGRLNDAEGNQSVLLIRIGDLVFSEWTYNGKLRAWRSDWKTAAKLFQLRYDKSDVTGSGLQFPAPQGRADLHPSSHDGISHVHGSEVWQGRTAALLRRDEGIILHPSEWRA